MDVSEWRNRIVYEREQKDIFFKKHMQSPIPIEYWQQFEMLHYYPPDPNFRFDLKLHEHCDKKSMQIEDTKGNTGSFCNGANFNSRLKMKVVPSRLIKAILKKSDCLFLSGT